jgi:hypothetical protein
MSDPSLDRREFAGRLAAGVGALPWLAAGGTFAAAADPPPTAANPKPESKPAPDKDAAAKTPPPADVPGGAAVELRLQLDLIKTRYPDERLTDEILRQISEDVQADRHRAEVMNSYPLKYSDEPPPSFAAWRSDRPA